MAAALPAALHAGQLHGHHVRAAERHDPADRADEAQFLAAPVHALREGQAEDHIRKDLRQDLRHGLAFINNLRPHIIAFFDEVGGVDVSAPGKALCGAGGIAVRVIGRLNRGASLFHLFIGLLFRSVCDEHGQTAGRGVNGHLAEGKARFFQLRFRQLLQLGDGAGEDIRRHFFRSDFEKEILRHFAALPFSMGNPSSFRFFR